MQLCANQLAQPVFLWSFDSTLKLRVLFNPQEDVKRSSFLKFAFLNKNCARNIRVYSYNDYLTRSKLKHMNSVRLQTPSELRLLIFLANVFSRLFNLHYQQGNEEATTITSISLFCSRVVLLSPYIQVMDRSYCILFYTTAINELLLTHTQTKQAIFVLFWIIGVIW